MILRTPEELADDLRKLQKCTVITHCRPDGDTVGSAAALCYALRALGIDARVLRNPELTDRYAPFLKGMECETPEGTVISVDVPARSMLPVNYSGPVAVCIDHHGSNDIEAEYGCVEPQTAACGEIIYRLLRALGVTVDQFAAEAIYAAISTDTGCFRYNNTTPSTLRIAADLMEAGVDTADWNYRIFEVKTRSRIKLEAHLAKSIRFFADGRLAVCFLSDRDRLAMGATEDDAASIANFPRNMEGVQLGAMIRELQNGKCKLSLRSDPKNWNSAEICGLLGGGGHKAASGATLEGNAEYVLHALLTAIRKVTGWDVSEDV